MNTARRLIATILMIIIIVPSVVVASFYYLVHVSNTTSNNVTVEIHRGESVKSMARKLRDFNVISNDKLFIIYVMYNDFQTRLKAGEYEFNGEFSIRDVVTKLLNHEIKLRRVTIPEGLTLNEIGELFEKNGVFTQSEFIEAVNSDSLKREYLEDGIDSFEGMLFPDTYTYWKDIKPKDFIEIMIGRKNEIIAQLSKENDGELNPANALSEYEIIILASIIEKESGYGAERELVSSVFHNRLRLGMKLDSDPTVIYGLGDRFDGNLRRREIEEYNRYNTYMIPGLPPTPIASPGKSSLYAALYPADSQYLYFVSRGDGTHYFSRNYREHQKAVYEYQIKSRKN